MTNNKSFHRTVSAIAAIGATALLIATIGPIQAGSRTFFDAEQIADTTGR